jgi:hypothetical protein
MKSFPKIITLLLVLLCTWVNASRAGSGSAFRVLEQDDRGCTVAFTVGGWSSDSLSENGKRYVRFRFDESVSSGDPGAPEIPCAVFLLGVPPQGEARCTTTPEGAPQLIGNVRPRPVPTLERVDGMPAERIVEGPAFARSGEVPGVLAFASAPEWAGDLRVVRVTVFPVQVDPVRNTATVHPRVVVRVDFTGPSVSGTPSATGNRDFPLRRAVLNASTAWKWRRTQAVALRHPAGKNGPVQRYKIPVRTEGIYKVTGSFLKAHGIDISSINPSTLRLFNNGGEPLPSKPSDPRPDSLIENPILLSGGEDGRFDDSDFFLFYGRGCSGWEYSAAEKRQRHYVNPFSDTNIYWLSFNDGATGKRMSVKAPADRPPDSALETFLDYTFIQRDLNNPMSGGMFWYSYSFMEKYPDVTVDLTLPDAVIGDTLRMWMRFKGDDKNVATYLFNLSLNDRLVGSVQFGGVDFRPYSVTVPQGVSSDAIPLLFHFSTSTRAGVAYLHWLEVQYRRRLAARDGRLRFYSPSKAGVFGYTVSGFSSTPLVLDVTDPFAAAEVAVSMDGGAAAFTDRQETAISRTFYAIEPSRFLEPSQIEIDAGSDLRDSGHRGELLILTHRDFMAPARIYQEFKQSHDSLSVELFDVQDVYDEFSAGLLDPAAIRDFTGWAVSHWTVPPKYLLLIGDGDYDYRNIVSDNDKNWIPAFERDGLTRDDACATDDWYTYVTGNDNAMDLAVGRLTVESEEQARGVIDKLIRYQSEPMLGDWRSLITLVGDDEIAAASMNETEHIEHSEELADSILPPVFNLRKIYLTEYPAEIRMTRVKPKAEDDLVDQINRGTLLVNYIGHGHRDLWAHEYVFERGADLPRLRNGERLPFFYAATCEFGFFDDPTEQHFTEGLLGSTTGGGIAIIAATRFCISLSNATLNRSFMDFCLGEPYAPMRIGEALRLAKLKNPGLLSNNEQYVLFGDPSMRLAVPRLELAFTSVDPDTFHALGMVRVEGEIRKNGALFPEAQGTVLIRAFDSKKTVRYITRYNTLLTYRLPGNPLFRGEGVVNSGRFQVQFIVPKEISYGESLGRLSGYFSDGVTDGFGLRGDIATGGSVALEDGDGPVIELGFTGQEQFLPGGTIGGDPELAAVIEDARSGINLTGEIGHRVTLTLDGRTEEDVTDRFQYDTGSYLKGKLSVPLTGLSEGEHSVVLKAWDNANNSASETIAFRTASSDRLVLERILNVPNPMSNGTEFTFELSLAAEVRIKVFTVDGRLIRTIDRFTAQPGFNAVAWDGTDGEGDLLSNGVYLYKVTAKTRVQSKTIEASGIGKLLVVR